MTPSLKNAGGSNCSQHLSKEETMNASTTSESATVDHLVNGCLLTVLLKTYVHE